jgi:hypothetical protein
LLGFILNLQDVELSSILLRLWCPIYVGIKVNLLLLKLDRTIVDCKPMPTKELSPGRGLDCKAKSRIRCQAGNNEKHLVVVRLQTEPTGKVAVMIIAHIEHIPEGLGVGDEY